MYSDPDPGGQLIADPPVPNPEAEFLDLIWTKVLRVYLLACLQSPLPTESTLPPPPPTKSGLKLVYNENFVYGNLKSESSQDYGQKPQRNCMFMNSASPLST